MCPEGLDPADDHAAAYGENPIPEPEEIQTEEGPDWIALSIIGIGGAAVLLLLVSTLFYRSKRRKRGDEHEIRNFLK